MLINYSFENFKSFRDKADLKLQASQQTTFNENLIRKDNLRILPSAVIYGANASGKSNVIKSLKIFSEIVRLGSIGYSHKTLNGLELCQFVHESKKKPISFKIDFIENNFRFVYEISIKVNELILLNREISYEKLAVVKNNTEITLFSREENNVKVNSEKRALEYLEVSKSFIDDIEVKLNENIDHLELFLSSGFKNIINSKIADMVINFITNKIVIIDDFTKTSANITINSKDTLKSSITIKNKLIDKFVKSADFGPQNIMFKSKRKSDEHSVDLQLFSEVKIDKRHGYLIPSEEIESKGTLKLIDFTLLFDTLFNKGTTFVIDEFDSALHSEIVKGILLLFNSSSVNTFGSQLIFSTHNPIYLSNKIFRRDQIFFTEKDKNNYHSYLYSLSDFGSKGVRNDENYMLNYFKGKYSSLPYIDFISLINNKEGE